MLIGSRGRALFCNIGQNYSLLIGSRARAFFYNWGQNYSVLIGSRGRAFFYNWGQNYSALVSLWVQCLQKCAKTVLNHFRIFPDLRTLPKIFRTLPKISKDFLTFLKTPLKTALKGFSNHFWRFRNIQRFSNTSEDFRRFSENFALYVINMLLLLLQVITWFLIKFRINF